eukprot:TRINITY_DN3122_c0_g1_i2.p1 TRINITY_DN3122_c0_g1~~TRINITY_DN3122_c0_g1_i2.p1  ORF type:complete len:1146 (+),score=311.48 TRINITY_DN3122_c0_g1_i2:32-3439(+)
MTVDLNSLRSVGYLIDEQQRKDKTSDILDGFPSINRFSDSCTIDHSHYEVVSSIPLPSFLTNEIRAEMRNFYNIGIFPEIQRVFVTVDNRIFLWNYESTDITQFDGLNQVITNVHLMRANHNVVDSSYPYLLLLTTPVDISIFAIKFSDPEDMRSNLILIKTNLIISTDDELITHIVSTKNGRIFFCTEPGYIYEFIYQRSLTKKVSLLENVFTSLLLHWKHLPTIIDMKYDEISNKLFILRNPDTLEVYSVGKTQNITQQYIFKNMLNKIKNVSPSFFLNISLEIISMEIVSREMILLALKNGITAFVDFKKKSIKIVHFPRKLLVEQEIQSSFFVQNSHFLVSEKSLNCFDYNGSECIYTNLITQSEIYTIKSLNLSEIYLFNDKTLQYTSPKRQFVCLSATSLFIIQKQYLHHYVEPIENNIQALNHFLLTRSDISLQKFLGENKLPKIAFNQMQTTNDLVVNNIILSQNFSAILIYISRLLTQIWNTNVCSLKKIQQNESKEKKFLFLLAKRRFGSSGTGSNIGSTADNEKTSNANQIEIVVHFSEENYSIFQNLHTLLQFLNNSHSSLFHYYIHNKENEIFQKEYQIFEKVRNLLDKCLEILKFFEIFEDFFGKSHTISLNNQIINNRESLLFRDFILTAEGINIIRSIFLSFANSSSNFERIEYFGEILAKNCPNVVSQNELFVFVAIKLFHQNELLAKSSGIYDSDEIVLNCEKALQYLKNCKFDSNQLEMFCDKFSNFKQIHAIIELLYINYEKTHILNEFLISKQLENVLNLKNLNSEIIQKFYQFLMKISNEDFLFYVFKILINHSTDSQIELFTFLKDFQIFEDYLLRLFMSEENIDFVWKFYIHTQNFGKATKILMKLVLNNKIDIDKKFHYLTTASMCIKNYESSINLSIDNLLDDNIKMEISEMLEVLEVQKLIINNLQNLNPNQNNNISIDIQNLTYNILDLSDLFNNYAQQFGFYEICLQIISISHNFDAFEIIEQLYEDILAKSNYSLNKLKQLHENYYPKFFPLYFVVNSLENCGNFSKFELIAFLIEELGISFEILFDTYYNYYLVNSTDLSIIEKLIYLTECWVNSDSRLARQYFDDIVNSMSNVISRLDSFEMDGFIERLRHRIDKIIQFSPYP